MDNGSLSTEANVMLNITRNPPENNKVDGKFCRHSKVPMFEVSSSRSTFKQQRDPISPNR